ncbi:TPA: hypothetical protein ACG6AJ_000355, partial [Escherichia coli]
PFHKRFHQSFVKSVDNHLFNNLKIRYFTWVVTNGLHCVNAFIYKKMGKYYGDCEKSEAIELR